MRCNNKTSVALKMNTKVADEIIGIGRRIIKGSSLKCHLPGSEK